MKYKYLNLLILSLFFVGCNTHDSPKEKIKETKEVKNNFKLSNINLNLSFEKNEYINSFKNDNKILNLKVNNNNLIENQKDCYVEASFSEKETPVVKAELLSLSCFSTNNEIFKQKLSKTLDFEGELMYKSGTFLSNVYKDNKEYEINKNEINIPVIELKQSNNLESFFSEIVLNKEINKEEGK